MSTRFEQRTVAKTASYTIKTPFDHAGQRFTNRGATGSVTLTLPRPQETLRGWWYEFEQHAAQTLIVAGATAGDICTVGNASADNVSYAIASNKVGRKIFAKCDGTQWHCFGVGDGFCVNGSQITPTVAELSAFIGLSISATELGFIDGVTAGIPQESKALVLGAGTILAQTKSANYTMTEADSGKITYIDTDAFTITLPATVAGYTYTFINAGADGAVLITLSPNSADKIMGAGLTAQDDKDLLNTKATAKKGDLVTLVGDGANGWFVTRMHGTWARQA